MGPNDQKPSSSVGASISMNGMYGGSGLHLRDGLPAPRTAGLHEECAIRAAVLSLGARLNMALLVTVRSLLMEQAPLLLAVSPSPYLTTSHFLARHMLALLKLNVVNTSLPVSLRFKGGTLL